MSSFDPSSLVEIHLVGFPVQVWARAQEHADELIRELTLIAQQVHDDPEAGDVPARLVALVDRLTVEY
ncbi:MAG: hypothetical protein ACRD0H_01265, partial [Actinomycetes bacterium]